MSAISRKIGEITLRDFKVLFDRPGFYRFHFKTVDEDYGMVKEEVIYLFVFNSVIGYGNTGCRIFNWGYKLKKFPKEFFEF